MDAMVYLSEWMAENPWLRRFLRNVVADCVAIYDCEVVVFIEELGAIGPVVYGRGIFEVLS